MKKLILLAVMSLSLMTLTFSSDNSTSTQENSCGNCERSCRFVREDFHGCVKECLANCNG